MNSDFAVAVSAAQVWPPVLAVDPGSQSTGIALRVGQGALEAVTIERDLDHGDHRAAVCYARYVILICREITRRNRDALNGAAVERGVDPGGLRHAVETLVPPTPAANAKGRRVAVAPTVLASLPTASAVLGMVVGVWPQSILVPPRGGSGGGWDALTGAPDCLRGRTPPGWMPGGSDRSHQRSAWAIAGAAHVLTAKPLPEQVRDAVSATDATDLDPQRLVAAMRIAIAQAGAWDLLARLPSLAGAVAAKQTGDKKRATAVKTAVETHLIEEG